GRCCWWPADPPVARPDWRPRRRCPARACTVAAAGTEPPARGRTGYKWKDACRWLRAADNVAPGRDERVTRRKTIGRRGNSVRHSLACDAVVVASTALTQPAARIDRPVVLAQLEIRPRVDAGGRAGRADCLANLDLVADVVQQALVVAVHAHP